MQKKFIVRLTDEERESLRSVIKTLNGSSEKDTTCASAAQGRR